MLNNDTGTHSTENNDTPPLDNSVEKWKEGGAMIGEVAFQGFFSAVGSSAVPGVGQGAGLVLGTAGGKLGFTLGRIAGSTTGHAVNLAKRTSGGI